MYNSSNGGSKASSGGQQPLVQWSEVPGHTGLLYCMSQTSNNPVVLMVKPDSLLVQEIKVVPAKAKIQDVVAIRHNASNSDQVGGYFSCLQTVILLPFCVTFSTGLLVCHENYPSFRLFQMKSSPNKDRNLCKVITHNIDLGQ